MKSPIIVFSILLFLSISDAYSQQNDDDNNTKQDSVKIRVVASFFPFYEITKEIGGNNIILTSFIPFGVEPHDWEPNPRQISEISEADMIIYNGKGFDAWIGEEEQFGNSFLVDISKNLPLIKLGQSGSANSGVAENQKHEYGYNPHIWLDPILVQNISLTINNALVEIDPNNTKAYKENTQKFIQRLDDLDTLIKKSLAKCELKDFISFHPAFQYFANRYGLIQHAVQDNVSPESEILPQQIVKILRLAKDLHIDTIYSEELRDQRLAQTLASEIPNSKVLLLSPIEGISKDEQKKDIGYIDKMEANLKNLKQGLKCE